MKFSDMMKSGNYDPSEVLVQDYEKYTEEDHKVWSIMYAEQMEHLPSISTTAFLEGLESVKFKPNFIPRFDVINEALERLTGWQVYVVPGLIDNKPFFEHLSEAQFPATTWIRKMSQLKYIEEPDMFHDVFGHVPLLTVKPFCDFIQGISKIALRYIDNPTVIELIARIYWYTVEFGLVQEEGKVRIYGAGLLSSPGESKYSVSDEPVHLPFDVQKILDTQYIKNCYQSQYYIIESSKQLYDSLAQLDDLIEYYVKNDIHVEPSPE